MDGRIEVIRLIQELVVRTTEPKMQYQDQIVTSSTLQEQAARCRRLAAGVADARAAEALRNLASVYERNAQASGDTNGN